MGDERAADGLEGALSSDHGETWRAVVVRVTEDDLRFRPGEGPEIAVPLADVTAVVWGLRGALSGEVRVGILGRSQDPLTLALPRTAAAERLRRTLLARLPARAMTGGGGDRPAAAAPAVPGDPGVQVPEVVRRSYVPVRDPGGRPVTIGRPWGTPCTGINLVGYEFDSTVIPDLMRDLDFLPVMITTSLPRDPVRLTPAASRRGVTWVDVRLVVARDLESVPPPAGAEADVATSWHTTTEGDEVLLQWVQGTVSLDGAPDGPAPGDGLTRALRAVVARSVGIASSDRPESGLRPGVDDSVDAWSAGDVDAIRRFSGC